MFALLLCVNVKTKTLLTQDRAIASSNVTLVSDVETTMPKIRLVVI